MNHLVRPLLLIALAAVVASLARAQSAASSAPVALLEHTAPAGISGTSFPLLRPEIARGALISNTATVVTWNPLGGVIGTKLEAGRIYSLEILSGPFEGERFEVDTAATIAAANSTVTLVIGDGSSHSTVRALPQDALSGAIASLRPQLTLGELPAMFSPALSGNDDPDLADAIQLYGPAGFVRYYLTGNGETWRRDGGGSTDQRELVLPPDVSVVLDLKSGARQLTRVGPVRTTAFRKNLTVGHQAFATGYPVELPLAALSAGGNGSNDAGVADTVEIFDPAAGGFVRYYLRDDGTHWQRVGDTTNHAHEPLLTPDSVIIIKRTEADDAFIVTPPVPQGS